MPTNTATDEAVLVSRSLNLGTLIEETRQDSSLSDTDRRSRIRELTDELRQVDAQLGEARKTEYRGQLLDAGSPRPGTNPGAENRSGGDLDTQVERWMRSESFSEVRSGGISRRVGSGLQLQGLDLRAITDAVTSGGAFANPSRPAELVNTNQDRSLQLLELIPKRQVPDGTGSTFEYLEDTTAAGAGGTAAEVAHGALKPEANVTFEVKTGAVRTIAHWLDAHRQVLEDHRELLAYLRSRLFYGLLHRVDAQMLNGNGTAPNIRGILNTSGINVYAPGAAEARVLSVRKAMTETHKDEFTPNVLVIHPTDWELVELSTDDSGMFRVNPNVANALSPRIFGLQTVVSTAITAGTALVGDARRGATLWERRDPVLLTTESDGEKFRSNIITLLAELRVGFTVERPAAWTKITFNGTV
jgi:HK97 family phage major capsid protein